MSDWLLLAALVPLILAFRIRGIERRAIQRFDDAGANTAERAILLEPGGKLAAFVHRRLERSGALRPVGNDRYYLEAAGYSAFRRRRTQRALIALAILFAGIAILYFSGSLA